MPLVKFAINHAIASTTGKVRGFSPNALQKSALISRCVYCAPSNIIQNLEVDS